MQISPPTHQDDPIALIGRFDAHEAPAFRAFVAPLLDTSAPLLHFDLSQVAFIDSTALAELVQAMKTARTNGGDIVLSKLSVPVRVILELTGLDKALTIADQMPGTVS
ncbi:MAG: STAS domain-containing protein [Actinomycetota bacterium]|nr:STAS domain-containing protein [Actinomycetota bacterium]